MRQRGAKAGSVLPAFNSYGLLNRYVAREYVLSFFVSFAFFFFIFFINQILVFAQKIVIKNVSASEIIILVALYIPQFLMYTIPFSSLTSASMVIGKLSSHNEILAMRSSGINTSRIFLPIVFVSLFFTAGTFFVADVLIPFSAQQYRTLYGEILAKVPTVELESYSSTRFGKRIVSNGVAEGNTLYDVLILDDSDSTNSRVVSAPKAEINLADLDRLIYRIDLTEPRILVTDSTSQESYSLASADEMTMYIGLSSANDGYSPITPSQMSINELRESIADRKVEDEEIKAQHDATFRAAANNLTESLEAIENKTPEIFDLQDIVRQTRRYKEIKDNDAFSFYYQYYRSELNKKIALSAACTLLVLLAFPLSFVKMKYGRLTGFGLSMFAACIYWFFLFYMHTRALVSPLNPALYLWAPDFVVFVTGAILFWRLTKR